MKRAPVGDAGATGSAPAWACGAGPRVDGGSGPTPSGDVLRVRCGVVCCNVDVKRYMQTASAIIYIYWLQLQFVTLQTKHGALTGDRSPRMQELHARDTGCHDHARDGRDR